MVLAVSSRAPLARLALVLAPVAALAAAPTAHAADPFALIVVPDTQNYADFVNENNLYNINQMRWIRDNMTNLNIKFVMHLGDFQNPGNPYRASATNIYEADMSRPIGTAAEVQAKIDKWNRADAAIDVLDNNNIPYSLVPGNHDYRDHDTKDEPYLYLQKFGPQRYIAEQSTWATEKRTYGGASPAGSANPYEGLNTFHRFSAGGYTFLNIALQFAPDTDDLRWAQQIINENPGLPTIITTHSYVNTKPAGSDYQRPVIFDKLVDNNPQIVMTFNGHLTGSHYVKGTNIAGKDVHQMLVDFQASQLDAVINDGVDYYKGAGTLRQVLVNPDTGRVDIKDYSTRANKFLPRAFTAPDNDGDIATYDTPSGFTIDFEGRFGLANKAGIVRTTSLRDGVNGYNATTDTWIDANAPTATHGGDETAWVDGNRANGNPSQALIRFDLFGAGNIPRGSMIDAATLTLHTSQLDNAQSPDGMAIYRLLETFGNGTSWNTDNGMSTDGLETLLAASGTVFPTQQGMFVTFDVTESVNTWSQGATNHGWLIDALGGNGWQFDTAENATIAFRPQLDVTFRVVPEPTAMAFFGLAALGLMRRARRL
jgi:hypothetical protein